MISTQNISVITRLVDQIEGYGQSVLALEITILFDNNIIPKEGTDVIVTVTLNFQIGANPIVITQSIPESQIIRGTGEVPNKLTLEGILYVPGKSSDLENLQASAELYYCV